MDVGFITKYKRMIFFAFVAIIWISVFTSFSPEIFNELEKGDLGPKLFIGAAIVAVVVAVVGNMKMAKTKKVLNYISEGHLPKELRDTLIEKIDDSAVPSGNLVDLLDNISVDQKFYYSFGHSTYKERKFSLYSARDNFSDTRDFVAATYFIARLNSLFWTGRKHTSHYSITKLYNEYLETFYSDNKLTVSLNDSVLGYFDYATKNYHDATGQVKGSFDSPENKIVVSMPLDRPLSRAGEVSGLHTGLDTSIYNDGNKIADIVILQSSINKLKKNMDPMSGNGNKYTKMFQNLDVHSEWQAGMLLGFAISEYAFVRTEFGRSRR